MKVFKLLLISLLFANTAFSQNDKNALELLEKVTAKTNSYDDMEFQFTYQMDNNKERIHEAKGGFAYIKKNKFQLKIDNIIDTDNQRIN